MKIIKQLFSPVFMGILLVLFAVSMATATFLENDFGSAAAYNMVYDTWWFELILLLLAVNLMGRITQLKLYRKTKLTIFLFHCAFIIMIAGAAITRYFGYEGTMHIREGNEENKCYSTNKYIGYTIIDNSGSELASHMKKYSISSVSSGNYREKISAGGKDYEIKLVRIIPNAAEAVSESTSGDPIISFLVYTGTMELKNMIIKGGEIKKAGNYTVGLDTPDSADISITSDSTGFHVTSKYSLSEANMAHTENINHQQGSVFELKTMQVIGLGNLKLVPQQFSLKGVVRPESVNPDKQDTGQNAFIFDIISGNQYHSLTLWDKTGDYFTRDSILIDGRTIAVSYGSMQINLPYSLKLKDFILDRYPGSNSPSGYKSDVILIDRSAGVEKPFLIYMNNILKYKGYRFYQSSYDQDEKGTILSVNHDRAGMTVTYTGYALLFLFIILSIINKKSVFHTINASYWSSPFKKASTAIALLVLLSGFSNIQAQKLVPGKKASDEMGKVLVQDQKGRTKPLYTLSNDILRKVAHKNDFEGLSSMQVFLGIYLDFDNWQNVPLIRVSNADIQKTIGIRGNMASFSDIVDLKTGGGSYKLSNDVQKAYAKSPGERNKFDKEVMKVDERLNIVYMVYTGEFLRLFPLRNGTHDWGSPEQALKTAPEKQDSAYLENVVMLLSKALRDNNFSNTRKIAETITQYQNSYAGYTLPSKFKNNAEIFYYKAKIFERLFPFYATIGLIMLIALITAVIRGKKEKSWFVRILGWILVTGFIFHTIGLGLRWYISGHSPMSNGYESMIFISWVTLLAGLIFRKKSPFALSATAVLGSMTLMVAHLSFMDPEITNLVPVLKSYWLTLHVSVITGSYGFLGLGAILGLISMILLSLSNRRNRDRIGSTIEELTVINYKTLTLGLYFLTIGTFLGAVWANESWGRYWGWDPKETWSLISIVVYSLVIHSRLIPGLKSIYAFNILSLFAFSTILMTYFGVNYYLSGLHSYAAGDAVPVPSSVYIAVISLAFISFLGYLRYSKWNE
jgi:cytochrome c-type biogenesis protein CcsB